MIPYVGTAFGFVLAAAFVARPWRRASGNSVGLVGVFVAVQSAEGYYLTPRILGSRLSLHPMAVFLGLLIGGKLFGLLGIILAVPTLAIAKVFVAFVVELYKGSSFYGGEDALPLATSGEERLADAADTVLANQAGADDPPGIRDQSRRDHAEEEAMKAMLRALGLYSPRHSANGTKIARRDWGQPSRTTWSLRWRRG